MHWFVESTRSGDTLTDLPEFEGGWDFELLAALSTTGDFHTSSYF